MSAGPEAAGQEDLDDDISIASPRHPKGQM